MVPRLLVLGLLDKFLFVILLSSLLVTSTKLSGLLLSSALALLSLMGTFGLFGYQVFLGFYLVSFHFMPGYFSCEILSLNWAFFSSFVAFHI